MSGVAPALRRREAALAALLFLALTVLMTWPQILHPSNGMTDLWDAKQNAWILHWDFAQTFRDPGNLFQAPILYPARYALAFSENLYGAAVFGFPLLAAGVSIIANYNFVFLLGMAFSAWAAWLLARDITGDPAASLLAGLVYAFVPWRFAQLPHINMQWGGFLCLLLLFLLRYLNEGRGSDLVLFAACFAGNLLATLHFGLFSGFLIGLVLAFEALVGGPRRFQRILLATAAAAAATLLCLPFLVPYTIAERLYGMRREIGELEAFSAVPADFLSAGVRNRLYGALTHRWSRAEADFFPGLLPVALAAIGLFPAARPRSGRAPEPGPGSAARRRAARALDVPILLAAAAAVAGWRMDWSHTHPARAGAPGRLLVIATVLLLIRLILALPGGSRFGNLGDRLRRQRLDPKAALLLCVGAAGVVIALGAHTPYYRFLFLDIGSVFRAIRVPARAIVFFHISLGVLAAWGLSAVTRRLRPLRRAACVVGALGLVAVEYRAFPLALFAYDSGPQAVYEWLRTADLAGAVLEWPMGFPHDCEAMLRQAEHGRPLVNGHQSYFPPAYRHLTSDMSRSPISAGVWDQVSGLGTGILVFHVKPERSYELARYRRFLRESIAGGRVRLERSFVEGGAQTFAFRPTRRSNESGGSFATPDRASRLQLAQLLAPSDAEVAPPTGLIHAPVEGQRVAPGFWGFGWAVDDSGIAAVEVGTELGPAGLAQLGGKWPGLAEAFPDFADAAHGGYGFLVPDLSDGPHTLRISLVGRDGGRTVLERHIIVQRPAH